MSDQPDLGHPPDHEPHFLFLRQERRGTTLVDVFYCARCLGRVDVEATGSEEDKPRPSIRALGSAVRG